MKKSFSQKLTKKDIATLHSQKFQDEEVKKQEMINQEKISQIQNKEGEIPLIFQKSPVLLIFESEHQAEIFNSRCHDTGEVATDCSNPFLVHHRG